MIDINNIFPDIEGEWHRFKGPSSGFGLDYWFMFIDNENNEIAELFINIDEENNTSDFNLNIMDKEYTGGLHRVVQLLGVQSQTPH